MSLVLSLSKEEESKLQSNLEAMGKPVEEYVRDVIAALPVERVAPDQTLELFAKWKAEAEAMTPEQIEEDERAWTEIMRNIQANRVSFPVPDLSGDE